MGLKEGAVRGGVRNVSTGVSVIPDSEADQKLIHRWSLDDVSTGTAVDSVGSADGTVNGVTSVSGDWEGRSAGYGDGSSDYIETSTLGSFGGNLGTPHAYAFSFQTTDAAGDFAGSVTSVSGPSTFVRIKTDANSGSTAGGINLRFREESDNNVELGTDLAFDDGNPHRAVINAPDGFGSPSTVEIYVDGVEENVTVHRNDGITDNFANFVSPWGIFAYIYDGTDTAHINSIIDDFCLFDSALTATEAKSYNSPWE